MEPGNPGPHGAPVILVLRTEFGGQAGFFIEAHRGCADTPGHERVLHEALGILQALLDLSIAGDDEVMPLQDRANARALLADADPDRQLSGFAGICREINSRSAAVYRILVSAAGSDPGAAALLAEYTQKRQEGQGQIARSLARAGERRPKLKERDAADIIHALMSPEVYRLLVCDRGWHPRRYEQWLKDTLINQLLPASSAAGAGGSATG